MSWPERIDIDNWYIDNHSLLLDLKILLLTPIAIYRGETTKSNPLGLRLPTSNPDFNRASRLSQTIEGSL